MKHLKLFSIATLFPIISGLSLTASAGTTRAYDDSCMPEFERLNSQNKIEMANGEIRAGLLNSGAALSSASVFPPVGAAYIAINAAGVISSMNRTENESRNLKKNIGYSYNLIKEAYTGQAGTEVNSAYEYLLNLTRRLNGNGTNDVVVESVDPSRYSIDDFINDLKLQNESRRICKSSKSSDGVSYDFKVGAKDQINDVFKMILSRGVADYTFIHP